MTDTALLNLPRALALAAPPLPLALLVRQLMRRYPSLQRRLGKHARRRFLPNLTDLPFLLPLEPGGSAPQASAVSRHRLPACDTCIAAPTSALLGRLRGNLDKAALFFSRNLVIEGDAAAGDAFAHGRGAKAIWHRADADAETVGADAAILADSGLLALTATHHPDLRRPFSVQAAAANPDVINFYAEAFGVKRVVLPQVLTVDEIAAPNPTLCNRCFTSGSQTGNVFEDPLSLDAPRLIPAFARAGVTALKSEGRQRRRTYVAEVVRGFYQGVAAAPVSGTELGEGMCSRRLPFWQDEIAMAVKVLCAADKDVAIPRLALVALKRERKAIAALAEIGLPIKVNDLTALPPGQPFWVGLLINLHNEGTLRWLAARGAVRVCLPPALPLDSIVALARLGRTLAVAVEVLGHDGRDVETLDGQEFLTVNGVQTPSQSTASMACQIEVLCEAGVTSLRMSPQSAGFSAICIGYVDRIAGRLSAAELTATLIPKTPGVRLSDGFVRGPAGAHWSGAASEGNRHGM